MAQCRAHRTNGKECRNQAILGGTVCRVHGGSAPQVKRKAKERLEELIDPAITRLARNIDSENEAVAQRAADSVLDRTGFKGIDRTQQLPYAAEELEVLERLTDDELSLYIALRRKVTEPGSSGSPTEAPSPEQASEVVSE